MKGKLIVLEGSDGSGKATQTGLLLERLKKEGKNIRMLDFPRYKESVYGELVGRALAGEFGDFLSISPYFTSLPYMLDRVSARDEIRRALEEGHVLCNRYTSSNAAHQAAKLALNKQKDFISFVEKGEYEELKLPRPTVVIFLDVPVSVAQQLVDEKDEREHLNGKKRDQHEKDAEYLGRVRDIYLRLAEEREDWYPVECVSNGHLLSKEAIHEKVYNIVSGFIS